MPNTHVELVSVVYGTIVQEISFFRQVEINDENSLLIRIIHSRDDNFMKFLLWSSLHFFELHGKNLKLYQ